jgi:type III secretion system YscJ/HrcJ family lipoprotein
MRAKGASERGAFGLKAATLLASTVWACSVPIAGNLDDVEANRVFVALDRSNVDATKEPDPTVEGRWRVEVSREDVPQALAALQSERLPRRNDPGLLEAVGKGSLVPSEAAENAALTAGIGAELEHSIEGIEGILSARVHLSIPVADALEGAAPHLASAGVLIEYRGATPPVTADVIQRLVAGAVSGLAPADVAVVMVSRSSPARPIGADLSHVGPIAVSRSSLHALQGALALLIVTIALLATSTLVLYSRLSRVRAELLGRDAAPGR